VNKRKSGKFCPKFYSLMMSLSKKANGIDKTKFLLELNDHISSSNCKDCKDNLKMFAYIFESDKPFCQQEKMWSYLFQLAIGKINKNDPNYVLEALHFEICDDCKRVFKIFANIDVFKLLRFSSKYKIE
jgi:hypothetical protein